MPRQIGVQLIVRGADQPSEDLILEIGELAWLAPAGSGGSVAWPMLDGPRAVRLIRAATCEVLVGFEAPLDTRWHLELGPDGRVTVTDATQLVFEWGPGMVELNEPRCR